MTIEHADADTRQETTPAAAFPGRAVLSALIVPAPDPAGPPAVVFDLGPRFGDALAPYVNATPVQDEECGAAYRALDEHRTHFAAELVLPMTQVPHAFAVAMRFDNPDALAALIDELKATYAALIERVPPTPADPAGL